MFNIAITDCSGKIQYSNKQTIQNVSIAKGHIPPQQPVLRKVRCNCGHIKRGKTLAKFKTEKYIHNLQKEARVFVVIAFLTTNWPPTY